MQNRRWWVLVGIFLVAYGFPSKAYGQTLTVEPQSSINLWAYCTLSGAFYAPCSVSLANSWYYDTGGHNHTNSKSASQYGHLSNTGGPYYSSPGWSFTFTASRVGGEEYIEYCSPDFCNYADVLVAYSNIYSYSGDSTNVFVGATTPHPTNHWGTSSLNSDITSVTQQYHNKYSCYSDYQVVGVNDMALPNGGVFDLNQDWSSPHNTHDRGNAVDFRAKPSSSNSIIYDDTIINDFMAMCRAAGLSYTLRENQGTSNEHVHCATNSSGT